jgi:acyl-coenzyme A thioesterase PaaI-like protein
VTAAAVPPIVRTCSSNLADVSTQDPHDRLGAAVRALADIAVRTGAGADELAAAAASVEAVTAELGAQPDSSRVHDSPYHPMSIVGGTAHPWGPQLHTVPEGSGVVGVVTLGPSHEGGPGLTHGGVLSLMFDHAMGQAVYLAGQSGMTVSLEVRYRAPTPLGVPLTVRARVDRTQGRRVFVTADVRTGDVVTAEASGVFLTLTAENVAQIFPANRIGAEMEIPPGPEGQGVSVGLVRGS